MKELIKEVEQAYQLLASIPVSGDAVDAMAIVRNKLRTVYAGLKKADNAEGGDA
jgi:hypothetical protein